MSTKRLVLALLLASVALADNITTILADSVGGIELNPIVALFLSHPILFYLFTVFKCFIVFLIAYRMRYQSWVEYAVYLIVLIIFLQATISNANIYLTRIDRMMRHAHERILYP